MSSTAAPSWSYRAAVEARDPDAAAEHLHDDVVLHSPATETDFVGRDEVEALLRLVLAETERFEVVAEHAAENERSLWFRVRIGGGDVTLAELFRLDDEGKIREITICGRPLAGSALFFKAVGPQLAVRNHGPRRGRLVRAMTRSFPAMLARIDRLGTKLAR